MKMPEYDNRPAANTALHSEGDPPPWQTAKFVILGIGLPIGYTILVLVVIAALVLN